MNETEWLTSTDAMAMLQELERRFIVGMHVNEDRMRLFVEAMTGISVWVNMEKYTLWNEFAAEVIREHLERNAAALLRDIFGNPFRHLSYGWRILRAASDMSARALESGASEEQVWHGDWMPTVTVLKLAQTIYDDRRFEDMPILGDSLEEADCTDAAILRHCRRKQELCVFCNGTGWLHFDDGLPNCLCHVCLGESGPHVRGCWVLDLILPK
jgi:hypothetical protein